MVVGRRSHSKRLLLHLLLRHLEARGLILGRLAQERVVQIPGAVRPARLGAILHVVFLVEFGVADQKLPARLHLVDRRSLRQHGKLGASLYIPLSLGGF